MQTYDAIIIGAGPAGLSSAIYLARARFRVLVLEKETVGGQITLTDEVVNYPGVFKTSGKALTDEMRKQAEAFGAEIKIAEVTALELTGEDKVVRTDRGDFRALGIVYAAGAHPRLAGFEGEEEFRGHGVAYCATCDGEFFSGKDIFVVGGGFAAVEEGLFLTRFGKSVTMLVRGDDFSIHTPAVEELKAHPKISVRYRTEVARVTGDGAVRSVTLRDRVSGGEEEIAAGAGDCFGVFVFAGYAPENALVRGQLTLDPSGYVVTDENRATNIPGVFAAGDICVKKLRQVVTAVSDGATAATALEKYLDGEYRKRGLKRGDAKPSPKAEVKKETPRAEAGAFLDDALREALAPVLARFERKIILRLYEDESRASAENRKLVTELASLSEKISAEFLPAAGEEERHTISICGENGNEFGLRFHGVPGGHEFNSFVLAMYNAAGPGQDVGAENQKRIEALAGPLRVRIAVSLSCTMCPDLVAAAERIAADNPNVTVDVYDFQYYPALKEKYNIMSVPCMIVNDRDVYFGKKSLADLLTIFEKE